MKNSKKTDPAYCIRELRFSYPGMIPDKSEGGSLYIPEMEISKGCINVIRGHNGSGKTTLMKLLCGLLEPGEGTISSPEELRAVLVQQEPYLFHGTVLHNLSAPLRFQNKKENREELIKKNLQLVGLEEFGKRKARELSGGEKKRVAIARALVTEPDVLLLDEPDANVDAATSKELEKLILTLRDKGMTVVLCSHHKGFAYRTSDRILDLYKGSPVDHDENIFKGRYSCREGLHSCFDTGKSILKCPARQGEFSTAVISPENITLSRDKNAGESMNRLPAIIESVSPYKTGQYTIRLDCKGYTIKTRVSDSELSLNRYTPEEELEVLFSPSAIQLY